ncbi:MAG: lysylphosphatidylglycerol synthase domain-containing protein [Acidimicrobiia bacterium]
MNPVSSAKTGPVHAPIMPVPGGVGVAEATITALLVLFGVEESVAFAATIVFRVITFYLPAVEGFFGARWLKQHGYI